MSLESVVTVTLVTSDIVSTVVITQANVVFAFVHICTRSTSPPLRPSYYYLGSVTDSDNRK